MKTIHMDFNNNKYDVKSHAHAPSNLKTIPQPMMRHSSICWYIFGYKHAVGLFDFFLIFFEEAQYKTVYLRTLECSILRLGFFFPYFYEHL